MAEGILKGDTLLQVHNVTVNAGANFLTGAATSAFGSTVKAASEVSNIAGGTLETAAVAANVSAQAIAYLQQQLTSYAAEVTVKIATVSLGDITKYVTKFTTYLIETPAEVLAELSKPLELSADLQFQDMVTEKINNITAKASEAVDNFMGPYNNMMSDATAALESISAYVQQGPEFIEKEIDKYVKKTMDFAYKNGAKAVNLAEETKQKMIEKLAMDQAQQKANEVNQKQRTTIKEKLDKVLELKEKAVNAAKALSEEAIMKIKGLFGA